MSRNDWKMTEITSNFAVSSDRWIGREADRDVGGPVKYIRKGSIKSHRWYVVPQLISHLNNSSLLRALTESITTLNNATPKTSLSRVEILKPHFSRASSAPTCWTPPSTTVYPSEVVEVRFMGLNNRDEPSYGSRKRTFLLARVADLLFALSCRTLVTSPRFSEMYTVGCIVCAVLTSLS